MDNLGPPRHCPQHGGVTSYRPERRLLPTHVELADHAVVLARADGELQVGVEPRSALIFAGPGYPALLDRLRAPTTIETLVGIGQAAGLSPADVTAAVQRLRDAGLLAAGGAVSGRHRVRLVGAGPVGRAVAGYLVEAGVAELVVFDPRVAEPDRPTTGRRYDRATALAAAYAECRTTQVVTLDHWSKPETLPVDLTLVIADGPEVDRVVTEHLVRLDQPHLVVRSLGEAVWVGPLVLPGRTPCLRCTDLTRTDADPGWPRILAQLGRLELSLPPLLGGWAATVTAAQALTFLGGGRPDTAGATLELTATDLRTELRTWPSHAECGCRWRSDTEWGRE